MKYDFNKAISKAIEPVGKRAFHAIIKTVTDGLPQGIIGTEMWQTNFIARQATDAEAKAAAKVSLRIEEEARYALAKLFVDKEFRAALTKDLQTGHGRKMANERQLRRSALFEDALKMTPDRSTKEIVNALLDSGKIEDIGDAYLVVGSDSDKSKWPRIAKTTTNSKLSRLRKKLQNT